MSKMNFILPTSAALAILGTLSYQQLKVHQLTESWVEPALIQDKEEKEGPDKNRAWTDAEKQENNTELSKILNKQNQPLAPTTGLAGGVLNGEWTSRGPRNKPGCWQFTEVDSTDNTVWAATCGHYGGTQFIWKGSLAGDDFNLISGRLPTRYQDIFGFPKSNGKRLIVSTEDGKIFYTDNDGSTWTEPTGINGNIQSISVDFKNNKDIFATDGQRIYKSTNQGNSFTQVQDFSSTTDSKLYSIRFDGQPGFGNIYLARKGSFYKWNGSSFTLKGSFTWPGKTANFSLGGDTRKLYAVSDGKYFSSTNEGASWTSKSPTGYYYGTAGGTMSSGVKIGVNPENPEYVIGGYTTPTHSKNGLTTTTTFNQGWGHYQGGTGGAGATAMAVQDARTREMYHPDFQASQFFYNKDGQVFSIRSTDGGLFVSYNDWTITNWTGSDYSVYYNLNLFGSPSQEAYSSGIASGYKNLHDISVGTQDQGDATWYGETDVLQNPGGDGRHKITANGKTVFSWNYTAEKVAPPYDMYDGSGNWRGTRGMASNTLLTGTSAWYFHDGYVDLGAQDSRFWILSKQLIRATWNGSAYSFINISKGSTSDYFGAIAQSTQTPDKMWTVKGATVYKSTNRGVSWDAGTSWGGSRKASWARCGLWVSPINDSQILVACPSGNTTVAAFSENGGTTWTNVSGNLPNADIGGMKGEKTGRLVFASTKYGPYVFDTQNKTWSEIAGNDTPLFNGRQMEYLESNNIMRFSTWGQGVWDFKINSIGSTTNSSTTQSSASLSSQLTASSIAHSSNALSSVASSSSATQSDICAGIPEWQNKTYNWTGTKEYVTYQNKLYSHTDWVNNTTPDNNSGWTFEGDCLVAVSSEAISSSGQLSSSEVIVAISHIKNLKISALNQAGFKLNSVSANQNLKISLLNTQGAVVSSQKVVTQSGLQSIQWNSPVNSGNYILKIESSAETKNQSVKIW